MIIFYAILSFTLLVACGSHKKNDTNPESKDAGEIEKSTHVDQGLNSIVFENNCVIFLMPDSIELSNMQENNNDGSYDEYVADLTWYPGLAGEMLDSFKISNIYCDKEIIILRSRKSETKLNRKEINGDMILLNIDKDPIITSAIEFDREATLKYFDKQTNNSRYQ